MAISQLKKTRGEMEVQKPLLLRAVPQADRASAQGDSTLLLLVCSTNIPWPCMSLCQWLQQSPWGDQSCTLQRPFSFPATHPQAILACHPPAGETAVMSQGKGTQDALRILEGLSLNSKETLIYALSSRKYFFKRHCSYLGCSCTTASHK